jgi:hypothetical protein
MFLLPATDRCGALILEGWLLAHLPEDPRAPSHTGWPAASATTTGPTRSMAMLVRATGTTSSAEASRAGRPPPARCMGVADTWLTSISAPRRAATGVAPST